MSRGVWISAAGFTGAAVGYLFLTVAANLEDWQFYTLRWVVTGRSAMSEIVLPGRLQENVAHEGNRFSPRCVDLRCPPCNKDLSCEPGAASYYKRTARRTRNASRTRGGSTRRGKHSPDRRRSRPDQFRPPRTRKTRPLRRLSGPRRGRAGPTRRGPLRCRAAGQQDAGHDRNGLPPRGRYPRDRCAGHPDDRCAQFLHRDPGDENCAPRTSSNRTPTSPSFGAFW